MQEKLNITGLLSNDDFVDWVNNPNISNSSIWLELIKKSDDNRIKIEEAKKIITSFNSITVDEFSNEMTNIDIKDQWQSVIKKSSPKKKSFSWLKYAAIFVAFISVVGTIYKTKFSSTADFNQLHQDYDNVIVTLSNGEVVEIQDKDSISITTIHGDVVESKDGELRIINSQYASNLSWQAIKVPRGRKIAIILSDGTKVHLNSDTELVYPDKFGNENRLVKLKGEAFFDVAHNADKPFIVENNTQTITVLGTKFNLNCYDNQSFVKTTLVEGSVKINSKLNSKSLILSPNEHSSLAVDGSELDKKNVDTKLYTSWINEILYFNNEELGSIAIKLERWYDVKIIFNNEENKKIHFTGIVRKDKSITHILDLIEKTSNIEISSNKNEIIIN